MRGYEIAYLFNVRRGLARALSAGSARGLKPALATTALIVVLQLLFTCGGPVQAVFNTVALDFGRWLPILSCAATLFVAVELEKLVLGRFVGRAPHSVGGGAAAADAVWRSHPPPGG